MFGQLVVGPPGSGKSTYCAAMQQYCTGIKRDVAIVNLDPANEKLPYECAIDIRELIQLQEVMESFELGPNGGLIYAMEYLVKNLAWLKSQLDALRGKYLVFDFPGQVELFTQHDACKVLASTLINKWNYRMCTVQLIDAHHCSDASKYISCVTMSLSCMLHLETPHVSFLSKADLVEQYGALSFGLEYYTNGRNLKSLLSGLGDERDPFVARHKKLSEKIIQVVEEFCLVSFSPLSVIEKDSMTNALKHIDKAIGYIKMPKERYRGLEALARASSPNVNPLWNFGQKYVKSKVPGGDAKKRHAVDAKRSSSGGDSKVSTAEATAEATAAATTSLSSTDPKTKT